MSAWEPGFTGVPERFELEIGLLRPFGPDDLEPLLETVNANLEHLRPWMPWAAEQATPQAQGEFLQQAAAARAAGNDFVYGVFGPAGEILGAAGLHARGDPGVLEIGYWVTKAAEGRGIATAASRTLVRLAAGLPGVERIEIRCDERNARSIAIPRRLGFQLVDVETRPPTAPGESGRLQVWSVAAGSVADEVR